MDAVSRDTSATPPSAAADAASPAREPLVASSSIAGA